MRHLPDLAMWCAPKQAEKEKEAAIRRVQAAAAAEYAAENAKLARHKAATEAAVAEKVRRGRVKARKQEHSELPQVGGLGCPSGVSVLSCPARELGQEFICIADHAA
jgi:hypothetical protein